MHINFQIKIANLIRIDNKILKEYFYVYVYVYIHTHLCVCVCIYNR